MPEQTPSPAPVVVTQSSSATLRPVGVLIKDAWQRYSARFATLTGIVAIPSILMAVGLSFVTLKVEKMTQASAQPDMLAQELLAYGWVFLVAVVIIGLLYIWAYVTLAIAVADSTDTYGVVEAYRRGSRLVKSYLWISILTTISITIGLLCLIIPGIIVGVWVCLATYVLVVEGVRGFAALQKSTEYVKGHWWAVFGRIFLFYIISFLISAFLEIAASGSELAANLAGVVMGLFVTPFAAVCLFLLYQDLKSLKPANQ